MIKSINAYNHLFLYFKYNNYLIYWLIIIDNITFLSYSSLELALYLIGLIDLLKIFKNIIYNGIILMASKRTIVLQK